MPKKVSEKTYRVVEIRWHPRTPEEIASSTSARSESAALWSRMVKIHARYRRANWKWPTYEQWDAWARGKFLMLSAQSVQQTVGEFIEVISATTKKRKAGDKSAKYPWKTKRKYRDVTYTNQTAKIRNGFIELRHGFGGNKVIYIPFKRELPGRFVEATLSFGVVRIVCELPVQKPKSHGSLVGVDLGVNTLLSVTDDKKAVVVSGREVKAIVQYRNKSHAVLSSRLSRCKPGSSRQRKLSRARRNMSEKCASKIKDLLHKATHKVAKSFPNSPVVVGKPFNDAARKMGRVQAQQVSQASTAKLIAQLAYKLAGATEVNEAYSSQTCPVCGCRQKCRRVYKCKECGLIAPRDVVGAVNIRSIGLYGEMRKDQPMPSVVTYIRPLRKYPGSNSSSKSEETTQVVPEEFRHPFFNTNGRSSF